MSNLLSQASLVMIPSGYKEDVVYSQIPTNGNGDLSFTRASNGTRINSAGLVEVCPWNLLSNSEEFSNANGWFANTIGGSTSTQTSNYGVAPNGTTTADRIQLALNGGGYADWVLVPTLPIVVGQTYTYSIYLKSLSGTPNFIYFGIGGGVGNRYATITSEWVRYTTTFTATATDVYPRFLIEGGTSSTIDILAWGFQLNIGSTAKPYFPTTDRLNVPRLTYQNGGGGCPSLLLEKQSTNLVLYSEQFDNADWSKIGSTITANATISPDGTQNADKLIEDTSTGNHRIVNTAFAVNNGNAHSQSWYVKYFNNQWIQLNRGQEGSGYLNFDLINGVVGYTGGITDYQISNMANGWYRISINYVVTGTYATAGISILDTNVNARYESYVGDGTSGVYIWGCQYEQSSYPTSYIPTTSSSATRVADVYSRSLSNIASGTAYINITDNVALGSVGTHLYGPFSITGASLGLHLSRPNNQRLRLWTQASANVFQTTVTNLKLAITWDGTNVNVYQNGVKVVTNYAYALTNVNNLFSSTSLESSATISEIVLFNSVLTDAECISLTS